MFPKACHMYNNLILISVDLCGFLLMLNINDLSIFQTFNPFTPTDQYGTFQTKEKTEPF